MFIVGIENLNTRLYSVEHKLDLLADQVSQFSARQNAFNFEGRFRKLGLGSVACTGLEVVV